MYVYVCVCLHRRCKAMHQHWTPLCKTSNNVLRFGSRTHLAVLASLSVANLPCARSDDSIIL